MLKPAIVILISFLFYKTAFAQKDTSVYYLTATGKVVTVKDSADYFLVILPPDTNVDKKLFRVNEYYSNGKPMMMTASKTKTLNMKFQGPYISFYPNGRKKLVRTYEDGVPVGDEKEYYPNGKLYNLKKYKDHFASYDQCRDTTGKVLAENGRGTWIRFNDDFSVIIGHGPIKNGVEDGVWVEKGDGFIDLENVYVDGKIVKTTVINEYKPDTSTHKIRNDTSGIFTQVDTSPEFPGGIEAFYRFLLKNIDYPLKARQNRTQGKVILTFIVEKDGSLTNIKIVQSVGDGCDEEAIRILQISPKWAPAMQGGRPVSAVYHIPIGFHLSN